ncbi:MAG: hypothetical protein KBD46_03010 [Candidatus Levybacteria bacterium]|nr:hypothetical protein [Candidatus Levybacteria bacterium]
MKWIFVPLFLFVFLLSQAIPTTVAAKKSVGSSIAVSGQYLKVKNVVRAYFGNLKGVKSVSYTLMYEANGVGQGVMGGFAPGKKKAVSKDMYLGTCSGKVCTPHRMIKNIQLEVITNYTNGKSSTKTMKVK